MVKATLLFHGYNTDFQNDLFFIILLELNTKKENSARMNCSINCGLVCRLIFMRRNYILKRKLTKSVKRSNMKLVLLIVTLIFKG